MPLFTCLYHDWQLCFYGTRCVRTAAAVNPDGSFPRGTTNDDDDDNDGGNLTTTSRSLHYVCKYFADSNDTAGGNESLGLVVDFTSDDAWFHQANNSLYGRVYLIFLVLCCVGAAGAIAFAMYRWRAATSTSTGHQLQRQLGFLTVIWLSLAGRSLALWLQNGFYEGSSVMSILLISSTALWWWGSCQMTIEPLISLDKSGNPPARFRLERMRVAVNVIPVVWILTDVALGVVMASMCRDPDAPFNDVAAYRLLTYAVFACIMAGLKIYSTTRLLPMLRRAAALEQSSTKRLGVVSQNLTRMRSKASVYLVITLPMVFWSTFYLVVGSAPFYYIYHLFYLLAFPVLLTGITLEIQRESSSTVGGEEKSSQKDRASPPPSFPPMGVDTSDYNYNTRTMLLTGSAETTRVERRTLRRDDDEDEGSENNNNNLPRLASPLSVLSRFSGSDTTPRRSHLMRTQEQEVESLPDGDDDDDDDDDAGVARFAMEKT